MKTRWLVAALGSALLIAGVALAQEAGKTAPAPEAKKAAPGGKPTMEVPRLNYDFGETFHLDAYGYAFVVRNRGNADLIIEDVKPGCGCTAAKFDRVIAPGKEGKIVMIGYDAGKQLKDEIRSGVVLGAISQDPVQIGYKCVESAVKAIKGEKLPKIIDTGFKWYDKSNVDSPDMAPLLYD